MADELKQTEQTPKGLTVPVPKRDDFFRSLKQAAKLEDRSPDGDDQPASSAGD
mgnify:CR=1 FL=1